MKNDEPNESPYSRADWSRWFAGIPFRPGWNDVWRQFNAVLDRADLLAAAEAALKVERERSAKLAEKALADLTGYDGGDCKQCGCPSAEHGERIEQLQSFVAMFVAWYDAPPSHDAGISEIPAMVDAARTLIAREALDPKPSTPEEEKERL